MEQIKMRAFGQKREKIQELVDAVIQASEIDNIYLWEDGHSKPHHPRVRSRGLA
ncbi:MAG: hypothetical protein AABX52_02470 [Nanoarchaeota archaeon]